MTSDFERRFGEHRRKSKKPVTDFYKAINEDGWENFEWVIIEDNIPLFIITVLEEYYVELYNTFKDGYNMTPGGESRHYATEETRQKMSDAKKGMYLGEENPMYGKKHSSESRQRISDTRKGKCTGKDNPNYGGHKDKILKKMSEAKRGNKNPMYRISGERAPASKVFEFINPDGNEVVVRGMSDFCRRNNLSAGCMYQLIKGKIKTHRGYIKKEIDIGK